MDPVWDNRFAVLQKTSDTETKLAEKDEALKGLQVILMKMTGEKDELAGENRTLKEQMELYKVGVEIPSENRTRKEQVELYKVGVEIHSENWTLKELMELYK